MTKKEEKTIKSLRKQGYSIKAIAKELHISDRKVADFVHSLPNNAVKPAKTAKTTKPTPNKVVNGTDEERIKLPVLSACKKNSETQCKCKDEKSCPTPEHAECKISINTDIPNDLLTDKQVNSLTKFFTHAIKLAYGYITECAQENGFDVADVETSTTCSIDD